MRKMIALLICLIAILNAQTVVNLVQNPYGAVNWSTYQQYKGNFHTHSTYSDGFVAFASVVSAYDTANYDILAMTDHNVVTWPWTGGVPAGMLAVRGDEFSNSDHTNGFFNFTLTSATLEQGIPNVQTNNGRSHINHPGRTHAATDWAWFIPWYRDYSTNIGMEVYNQGDRYPTDRQLWDNVNANLFTAEDKMVWGFSNDDMHEMSHLYHNYQFMLMPALTEADLTTSMDNGAFYFCYEPAGTGTANVPRISNIAVNNTAKTITITATGYNSISWIGPGTTVVGTGTTFNYSTYTDKAFVRAVLDGSNGDSFTQPFGFETVTITGPAGYYDPATGTGYALKTQLHEIIDDHTVISYTPGIWNAYVEMEVDKYYENDGSPLDVYSENPTGADPYNWTFVTNQCGTYTGEGDCYNREHSFPREWYGDVLPMNTDVFHIYLTDGYVNNQRWYWEFGEVTAPTYTSQNGCKVGPCSYPGFTGTVFEPIDEFKGDFARTYFYMATRYEDIISTWPQTAIVPSAMLDGSADKCFSEWALNMLLEWHANDPVSQKEIDRNEYIYTNLQHNRNPFIDNPFWVNEIWGGTSSVPMIIYSTASQSVSESAGTINVSVSLTQSIPDPVTAYISFTGTASEGNDFTVSQHSVSFPASSSASQVYTLTILNDTDPEPAETVIMVIDSILTNNSEVVIGTPYQITVTITSSDNTGGFSNVFENFENGVGIDDIGYKTGDYTFESGVWSLNSVYLEGSRAFDNWALRINDDTANASLTSPVISGVDSVSFWYRTYAQEATLSTFWLQKSVDGGAFVNITSRTYQDSTYTQFTYRVNENSDNIKLRILNDNQLGHLIIDNFEVIDTQSGPVVDTTPPSIISHEILNGSDIILDFSETLDPATSQTLTNYVLDNGGGNPVSATLGYLGDLSKIELNFAAFQENVNYTLTISNVEDVAGNPMTADTVEFIINTPTGGGSVLYEDFENGVGIDQSGYKTGDFTFASGVWSLLSVYLEGAVNSFDSWALRINDDIANASLTSPAVNGVDSVIFWYRTLNLEGSPSTFWLQKSVNGGAFQNITSQTYQVNTFNQFAYKVNDTSDNIKLRILNNSQSGHLIIDNFKVVGFGDVTPDSPANVTTSISGSDITISWDTVSGATGYEVYSSNLPYTGFAWEATVATEHYTVTFTEAKKFYYIVASTTAKALKSGESHERFIDMKEARKNATK